MVGQQLCQHRLRKGSDLLLEKLLCLLPDTRVGPILQLEKARQQRFAEHLGALTREERREMVNADHAQRRALSSRRQSDRNCGVIKGGGHCIYRDRVVGVCAAKRED